MSNNLLQRFTFTNVFHLISSIIKKRSSSPPEYIFLYGTVLIHMYLSHGAKIGLSLSAENFNFTTIGHNATSARHRMGINVVVARSSDSLFIRKLLIFWLTDWCGCTGHWVTFQFKVILYKPFYSHRKHLQLYISSEPAVITRLSFTSSWTKTQGTLSYVKIKYKSTILM